MKIKLGFTLIEVLIAISILSGMTLVLSQSFLATTRGSMKSEIQSGVKQSGDFAIRTMEQIIREASNISSSTCTLSPTPVASLRTLQINNPDGGITTFRCDDTNPAGLTRLASVSGLVNPRIYYLTSTDVSLGGTTCNDAAMTLRFKCLEFVGTPHQVQLNFSLSQSGTAQNQSQAAQASFQTTINVRN